MKISEREFQFLTKLAHEKFGIDLGPEKRTLVVNRLQPLIAELGLDNFQDYYQYLIKDTTGQAIIDFVNRLTTNYSYFFREHEHFDFLRNEALVNRTLQQNESHSSDVRIWSAGCSTGEEPYSLAMLLSDYEHSQKTSDRFKILATDVDTRVLHDAYCGTYIKDRVKNVPPMFRMKYFIQGAGGKLQVAPEIKSRIHFSYFNLIRSSYNFKGKFFAIFCRNVMIYFNRSTVKTLIERFYEYTEAGGYLFIGLTESLDRTTCPFRYVAPSVYRKI